MKFKLDIEPPTCTAQMKRIAVIRGRPMMYDTPAIKEAKRILIEELEKYAPEAPMEGPISLNVRWAFSPGKSHKPETWRVTRPDTDNLEKILKDCMTKTGYWKDDSQVVVETCSKVWSNDRGIRIEALEIKAYDE